MPVFPHRRAGILSLFLLSGFLFCSIGAAELKIPPSPDRWATDAASFLSRATVEEINLKLEDYEKETGHQVIVYIGKTTEGYPIEDFAVRAFQAWKVGRKGLDDGLILFIMAEDRAIRIEVGYGLEGVVPDIIAGRIINDVLVPKIRAGDPDGALRDAVTAIIGAISGTEPREPSSGRKGKGNATSLFIIIAAVIFLILLIFNPSFALWLLINIMSGRSGGGGFRGGGSGGSGGSWRGGGGGFRGGGGRSGGGGASGRW